MNKKINISEILMTIVSELKGKITLQEIVDILWDYGLIDDDLNLTDEVLDAYQNQEK